MIRRLLIVVTLAGFVLSGVSMSAHAASSEASVDVVVTSAQALSTADASAMAASQHSPPSSVQSSAMQACVECPGAIGYSEHDPGMLMALGCMFVAIVVAVALVLHVRVVRSLSLLPRALVSLNSGGWLPRVSMALDPPDLLALGISRR